MSLKCWFVNSILWNIPLELQEYAVYVKNEGLPNLSSSIWAC